MAASSGKTSAASNTAGREIVVTRVFDAPRDLVFQMWIDPQHVIKWWGPRGFTTTIHEMDVRPGGVWRFVMHGPNGVDYQNKNVYTEITRPERLAYSHVSAPQHEMTATFSDEGGKTRVTMRLVFPTAADRDQVVKVFNAIEGANQTLQRFAEHLANQFVRPDLVLTRIFDAPREEVFKAWTDPRRLQRWWGPKGFTNPVCEVDPRPGGAIRIHMRAPDGTVYPMIGVYREVVEPERLVFASAALDADGSPLFEILNTVTFSEQGGKTELTLRATVVKTMPQAAPHLAGMELGWNLSLDRLAQEVAR